MNTIGKPHGKQQGNKENQRETIGPPKKAMGIHVVKLFMKFIWLMLLMLLIGVQLVNWVHGVHVFHFVHESMLSMGLIGFIVIMGFIGPLDSFGLCCACPPLFRFCFE